jgi:hypothetical protein
VLNFDDELLFSYSSEINLRAIMATSSFAIIISNDPTQDLTIMNGYGGLDENVHPFESAYE